MKRSEEMAQEIIRCGLDVHRLKVAIRTINRSGIDVPDAVSREVTGALSLKLQEAEDRWDRVWKNREEVFTALLVDALKDDCEPRADTSARQSIQAKISDLEASLTYAAPEVRGGYERMLREAQAELDALNNPSAGT